MLVFFWGLLCLVLCATKLKAAPRLLAVVALLVGVNELAVMLPTWYWHTVGFGLQKNWTGKLLSILLCLLVIHGWQLVSPPEVGLVKPRSGSWRLVVPVVLVLSLAQFTGGFFNRHLHAAPSWEAHVYELLLPGIAEELFFRGVFLGLLNRVFARTLPFFGTHTSWGGLAGLILFVLGHCLSFTGPLQLVPHSHFTLDKVLSVGLFGILFLWVRERSGSCWAAMVAHNLTNVGLYIGLSLP
ncbi:MAG: CPBP family intramembrane metalloprotease [Hymenobacter sp.]|nr:MAG: CPBP family intramembrane metalloprotease [Hymenobacter sp.]